MSVKETIVLDLAPDQIDVILSALGEQPFIKVHELINVIRAQAVPQWQALHPDKKESE